MVADQPIAPDQLAGLIGVPVDEVEVACAELIQNYAADNRGYILQRVAGGLRFQSHPDMAPIVERFVLEGQAARLSAAALETMAIIAYKQPISRNQISAIRGVNAEGVVRTLEARGYVVEMGRDPGPGRAALYGTTPSFLERLGLESVEDLPPLGQFMPGTDVLEALESTLLVNPDTAADAAAAAAADSLVIEPVDDQAVGEHAKDDGASGAGLVDDDSVDGDPVDDDWAEDAAFGVDDHTEEA